MGLEIKRVGKIWVNEIICHIGIPLYDYLLVQNLSFAIKTMGDLTETLLEKKIWFRTTFSLNSSDWNRLKVIEKGRTITNNRHKVNY